MRSRRAGAFAAAAFVAAAIVAVALSLLSGEAGPEAPRARPAALPAAAALPASTAPVESAQAPMTLDDPRLRASLGRIAARALKQAARPTLDEVIEEARDRGPRDLLVALESHLREAPEDSMRLVERMRRAHAPRDHTPRGRGRSEFFVMSRALGRTLDDASVRAATLQLLRDVDSERRADGLVALMGRSEREVVTMLLGVFEDDPSNLARLRAASLLSYVLDKADPADAEHAKWVARATLSTPQPAGLRITAAAEILGRSGADPEDLELLKAELIRTDDPEVLSSLAYSLAAGGVSAGGLRGLLQGRQDEPGLKGVVDKLLAAMP